MLESRFRHTFPLSSLVMFFFLYIFTIVFDVENITLFLSCHSVFIFRFVFDFVLRMQKYNLPLEKIWQIPRILWPFFTTFKGICIKIGPYK